MTAPVPDPDDAPEDPNEAYEPDDHPHPLRAQDVPALIPKLIG